MTTEDVRNLNEDNKETQIVKHIVYEGSVVKQTSEKKSEEGWDFEEQLWRN